MIVDTGTFTATGSYALTSTIELGSLDVIFKVEATLTYAKMLLGNTAIIKSGSVITIILN